MSGAEVIADELPDPNFRDTSEQPGSCVNCQMRFKMGKVGFLDGYFPDSGSAVYLCRHIYSDLGR